MMCSHRSVRPARIALAAVCCLLAAPNVYAQRITKFVPFGEPTWSAEDFDQWVTHTFAAGDPTAHVLRDLHAHLCEQWAAATDGMRTEQIAHRDEYDAWLTHQKGPAPLRRPGLLYELLGWKQGRLGLEHGFLKAAGEALKESDSDIRASWQRFVADSRRKATLDEIRPYWRGVPFPDLVAMLLELEIDPDTPDVAAVTADYIRAMDDGIVAIQHRYYGVEERAARAMDAGTALEQDARTEMVHPLYELTITFANFYINVLQQPEKRAFEQAWIGLWFPDLAVPTPAEIGLTRIRQWLPADDHRDVMIDEIARSYQQRELSIDRRIMQLNPPEDQLRKRFDPDETEEVNEEFIRWFDEVEDLPYAIWQDEIMTEHVKRLKLTTDTCLQLRDMFTAEELPPDIWYLLSCVVLPDGSNE